MSVRRVHHNAFMLECHKRLHAHSRCARAYRAAAVSQAARSVATKAAARSSTSWQSAARPLAGAL